MNTSPHLFRLFVVASIKELLFDLLVAMGIKAILFDLDLTVTKQGKPPSQDISDFIVRETKSRGIHRRILTNSSHDRYVAAFRLKCGVSQPNRFGFPRKPMPSAYLKALADMNRELGLELRPDEVLLIDDKLDMCFGAIRAGMWAIRMTPLGPDTLILDRLMRRQERDARRIAEMNIPHL